MFSLDGYGAGPHRSLEAPLGIGAEALHDWLVRTRSFKRTHGGAEAGGSIMPALLLRITLA